MGKDMGRGKPRAGRHAIECLWRDVDRIDAQDA